MLSLPQNRCFRRRQSSANLGLQFGSCTLLNNANAKTTYTNRLIGSSLNRNHKTSTSTKQTCGTLLEVSAPASFIYSSNLKHYSTLASFSHIPANTPIDLNSYRTMPPMLRDRESFDKIVEPTSSHNLLLKRIWRKAMPHLNPSSKRSPQGISKKRKLAMYLLPRPPIKYFVTGPRDMISK
jgi:hypothetical protein